MRGGLSFGLVGLLVGLVLLAPGAAASETVLFHKTYRNAVEGNKVESIPVAAGYDSLRLTVNITAGNGFWSDVRGYASVTVRDPDGGVQFHAFKVSVVPYAAQQAGFAVCTVRQLAGELVTCRGAADDPLAPYTQEWTVALPPSAGEWQLVEVHATVGVSIFVTVDLVGIAGA